MGGIVTDEAADNLDCIAKPGGNRATRNNRN